jgi:hypothetical protein
VSCKAKPPQNKILKPPPHCAVLAFPSTMSQLQDQLDALVALCSQDLPPSPSSVAASQLSSAASPNYGGDLPSSSDVILSCASTSDDLCVTLEGSNPPPPFP